MRITLVFKKGRLPEGWIKTKIQNLVLNSKVDIVDGPFGSNLKAIEYVKDGIPLIRLQNVGRNQFVNKNIKYITKEKAESLRRHNFQRNDIVITKLGKPLGVSCLVPDYLSSGIIIADIIRVRVSHDLISRKFLIYAINSDELVTQFEKYTKGTTRPRVNLTKFRDFQISIPPFTEQKRIVTKIESIFAQIDATKKQLEMLVSQTKFTPGSLNMLKNNILKHAFEGKLVPQNYHDESIEKSLLKIRQERQRIWRKELLSKGKELKKFTYVESELIYTNAFELPQGWKSVKIQDVVITPKQDIVDGPFGSNLKSSEYVDHGIPIIRIQNIDRNHFINKNIHYVTKEKSEQLNRHSFSKNDVVITKLRKACREDVYSLSMILPPMVEQKRIVSKIESIFGNIDTSKIFFY